jgi:hypothetical protein
MFTPAQSQMEKERWLLVRHRRHWFQKERLVAGRVSGLKMKLLLTSAIVSVAHAIQALLTTPMLAPFLFSSTRQYGASDL